MGGRQIGSKGSPQRAYGARIISHGVVGLRTLVNRKGDGGENVVVVMASGESTYTSHVEGSRVALHRHRRQLKPRQGKEGALQQGVWLQPQHSTARPPKQPDERNFTSDNRRPPAGPAGGRQSGQPGLRLRSPTIGPYEGKNLSLRSWVTNGSEETDEATTCRSLKKKTLCSAFRFSLITTTSTTKTCEKKHDFRLLSTALR